jgi:hypothetical protein
LRPAPAKKVSETLSPSQQTSQVWSLTTVRTAITEVTVGGLWFKTGPGQKHQTLSEK